MNARLKRVLFAWLLVQALFLPAVLGRAASHIIKVVPSNSLGGNGDRPGVVDVYIKTYIINKRDTTQYMDEKGTIHYSKRDFYLSTAAKGTMGGPVKYRFFMEYVNMSMRDPALPPLFKDSYAEMIDSATVLPEVLRQLPATFTNPRHHE